MNYGHLCALQNAALSRKSYKVRSREEAIAYWRKVAPPPPQQSSVVETFNINAPDFVPADTDDDEYEIFLDPMIIGFAHYIYSK